MKPLWIRHCITDVELVIIKLNFTSGINVAMNHDTIDSTSTVLESLLATEQIRPCMQRVGHI